MTFKVVVNEPKTKKSFQVEKDAPSLVGKKIGDKFDGSALELNGFTLEITGGSDKDGTPMRKDLEGSTRIKALLTRGVGFRGGKTKKVHGKNKYLKVKGMRKRKYVRGNTISEDIAQVNCKIVEGEGDVEMMLGLKKEEVSQEKSEEKKEKDEEKPSEEKKEEPKEEKPTEEAKEAPKEEPTVEEKKEEDKGE